MKHSFLSFRNHPSESEIWASLVLWDADVAYPLTNAGRPARALVGAEALVCRTRPAMAQPSPILAVGWASPGLKGIDFGQFGSFFRRFAENVDLEILREHGLESTFSQQCAEACTSYSLTEVKIFIFRRMPFLLLGGPLADRRARSAADR